MNTPTHLLVSAGLFSRPRAGVRNAAVLLGALMPDLPIYVLWAQARLRGLPEARIWSELYFSDGWQMAVTVGNAAPIYALIAAVGALFRQAAVGLFGVSAIVHVALDFPLHAGDAHAHFWPISDWRFESPLSYWNPAHHGDVVQLVEAGLGPMLTVVLWRRFHSWPVRGVLLISLSLYALVPLYFAVAI